MDDLNPKLQPQEYGIQLPGVLLPSARHLYTAHLTDRQHRRTTNQLEFQKYS